MIAEVLTTLKNQLNGYLPPLLADAGAEKSEIVVFFDSPVTPVKDSSVKPVKGATVFKEDTVTLMLFNFERDVIYPQNNGSQKNPDLNINLEVVFIANFKLYAQSLHYISLILSYLQSNHQISIGLAPNIQDLRIELQTIDKKDQTTLWARTTGFLPAVFYKIKTLQLEEVKVPAPLISEIITKPAVFTEPGVL